MQSTDSLQVMKRIKTVQDGEWLSTRPRLDGPRVPRSRRQGDRYVALPLMNTETLHRARGVLGRETQPHTRQEMLT